jgi:hypothetical protein
MTSKASKLLAELQIQYPNANNELMFILLKHMISIKYIPKPNRWECVCRNYSKNEK